MPLPDAVLHDPAQVVVAACGAVGTAVALWLALSVVVAVVDEVRVRRSPWRTVRMTPGVPAVVRRLVALVVGLLLGSAALSAQAATPAVPELGWAATATLEPGWAPSPARSTTPPTTPAATPTPTTAEPRTAAPTGEVVVLRGDSLWSLAERRLGPDATRGEVLAEQHRLYTANADVIGDDPDRLLPGQVLRLP